LAPYSASRKEPDQCITPAGASLPTIVFECGWSESRSHLHSDRDLWLQGGRGAVRLVIIVKWRKNTASRTVKGDLEVFDLDPQGVVRSLQREVYILYANYQLCTDLDILGYISYTTECSITGNHSFEARNLWTDTRQSSESDASSAYET
jgi:hypothetical protein